MTGSYIVFSYDTNIRAKNSPQDCFLNARSNPFGYLADKNLWGTFGYPINFGPPEGIWTPDLRNRNPLRYPAAPRADIARIYRAYIIIHYFENLVNHSDNSSQIS